MALPKQVQAQADALDAYEKQVTEARAAEEPKPTDPPPADTPTNPNSQSLEPVATEPPKPAEDDPNSATWRQRYQSLQGQFNSQVPALQQQVRQLTDSVSQLTAQAEKVQAKAPAEPDQADLVTKTDVEAFGEDLVDLARRIAKEEFGKRESKYVKQIEQLQGQLSEATGQVGEVVQSQAVTANERFFSGLASALPAWESTQASAECQAWLSSRIPGTTATWDQALKDAASKRDVAAVVEVFEVFYEKHPALDPKAKPATQSNARQELQRQVAPGKSSASTAQQTSRRVYSARDYETESMNQLRLLQRGDVEGAGRIEAELNAALAEGRIKP
jgi:uncharacterized phage infection (PIP) family protein YhgE